MSGKYLTVTYFLSEIWKSAISTPDPWSKFCDPPPWKLICLNKWHSGTSEISTPTEIAAGSHFNAWQGTKTKRLGCYFQAFKFGLLLSGSIVHSEKTYTCILSMTGQVWESQKKKDKYQHLSQLPQAFRFSFNQPNRKRWGTSLVNPIKHLLHELSNNLKTMWFHRVGDMWSLTIFFDTIDSVLILKFNIDFPTLKCLSTAACLWLKVNIIHSSNNFRSLEYFALKVGWGLGCF